jgi:putative addiction module killer protein
MQRYTVYRTTEFDDEPPKSRLQIQNRVLRIEEEGHFGTHRDLDNDLWELKFNDGRRIYYIIIPEKNVIFLLGGNKNGQSKDIRRARNILSKAQKP